MVNQKGQAALTDAMYFLLIVSGLSALLFFFSVNYGFEVTQQTGLHYRSEYATSALKTLLYSSVPRVSGQTLEESTEVDFLLAAVKEDFADNGELENTQDAVVDNVVVLMEPLSDSFDYFYYIYLTLDQEFVFFMLYSRSWDDTQLERHEVALKPGDGVIYLCKPSSFEKLNDLVTNVGLIYAADSGMQLLKLKEDDRRDYEDFPALVNLTMWTSTQLPAVSGGIITDASHLNCKEFKKYTLKDARCDPEERVCEREWVDLASAQ